MTVTPWPRTFLRDDAAAGLAPPRERPAVRVARPAAPAPHRLLIVAATYRLPYRVLRCAKQCGAEVHVLGDLGAHVLALSRYCDGFTRTHRIIDGDADADLAHEINCLARDLGTTMVLPGDAQTTRALIAIRHLLRPACFPLPDLDWFDRLNDKVTFAALCGTLGLRVPETRVLADGDALAAEIEAGRIAYPVVLKPPALSGSQGFVRLDDAAAARHAAARIRYRPVLVQRFIPGRSVVASMYCQAGRITAFVTHEIRRRVYATFRDDRILTDLQRLTAHVGLTGVCNFDMIAGEDGDIHYLECNPRFFFSMEMAMLAGLNVVALGLAGEAAPGLARVPAGIAVRPPEAVLATPWTWPRLSRRDLATARHMLTDPLPLLFDHLGWPP